ncbi:MAG: hypothetical protein ACREQ5_09920 [Candidatus Dormibacteria bacterium]
MKWAAIVALLLAAFGFCAYTIVPPLPAKKPRPLPDTFQTLGTWPLSESEKVRLIHVPDSPTGLRCLVYLNTTGAAVLYCDDDLPRGAPVSN